MSTGPIARIPQLAPHLDHKRNELVLDKQFNIAPCGVWTQRENDVLDYMAKHVIDVTSRSTRRTSWVTTCCSLTRNRRAVWCRSGAVRLGSPG